MLMNIIPGLIFYTCIRYVFICLMSDEKIHKIKPVQSHGGNTNLPAKASHFFSTKNIGIFEILTIEILTKR